MSKGINALKTTVLKAIDQAYELGFAEGNEAALKGLHESLSVSFGTLKKPRKGKRV